MPVLPLDSHTLQVILDDESRSVEESEVDSSPTETVPQTDLENPSKDDSAKDPADAEPSEAEKKLLSQIETWMAENELDQDGQALVVKPAFGFLSAGVSTALTPSEVLESAVELFEQV